MERAIVTTISKTIRTKNNKNFGSCIRAIFYPENKLMVTLISPLLRRHERTCTPTYRPFMHAPVSGTGRFIKDTNLFVRKQIPSLLHLLTLVNVYETIK